MNTMFDTQYTLQEPPRIETHRPTSKLRWVRKDGVRTLQQEWESMRLPDSAEWRDVPEAILWVEE